jgi:predicted nucleic-acid-binding Zn-ribbon protein
MAKVLTCPECGQTRFIQKEVRKTGIKVVDGIALFEEEHATPSAIGLICRHCHTYVPQALLKEFKPLSLFAKTHLN